MVVSSHCLVPKKIYGHSNRTLKMAARRVMPGNGPRIPSGTSGEAMTEEEAAQLDSATRLDWSREERHLSQDSRAMSTSAFLIRRE
jgi:hypothetical protein